MRKICKYVGFMIVGFSVVLWLFQFGAFRNFVEICGKWDIWGLLLKTIITTIGILVIFLDYFLNPREKYLKILEDEETGIQVSEQALNSMVMAILTNNVEGVDIKSCQATEAEGEIKISLILEFTSGENVNEVSKKIIELLKKELANKVGISNVKVQIVVHKLSFQG